jgi:hypothetical protein
MRDDIDHLRQVDHHERAPVDEQVVGRQVAVREPAPGERDQGRHQLIPEVGKLLVLRPGLRQPRRGRPVGVADELQEHLGAGDLHRVGDRHPLRVQPAEGGELGVRPHPGDRLPAERGSVGSGPRDPGVPGPPALEVARVPVEQAVLRVAVPLRGQQAGRARGGLIGRRHRPAEQEDVRFLAGLDDAELGVDGGQVGDEPAGMRPGPALGRGGLIPGGPAFVVGQTVGPVGDGILRGQPLDMPVPLGERLLAVEAVTLPLGVSLADPAEGGVVEIRALAHW